jgi:nanoRNase/pAp phosphatase (c-di-AMP/oligoRNAs hydrolase)
MYEYIYIYINMYIYVYIFIYTHLFIHICDIEGDPNIQSQATYSMSESLVVDHHQSNKGNEALKTLR